MSRVFYLGIDGGQSSTEALIGNQNGHILGRGVAGPCNHVSGPEAIAKFRSSMLQAVSEAAADAALSAEELTFEGVCLGLSGGPDDKAEHIRQIIPSRRYKITHDAEIALAGAFEGAPGIIVIAGTGSMAYGRNQAGQSARAGGWGYLVGDEGGAWDLTRRALQAALKMEEGWGPATSLHAELLAATGSVSANALLHRLYTPEYPRSQVAALAPLVDRAANLGDPVAHALLHAAASDLTNYVAGVHSRLFPSAHPPVAYIGGVFASDILRAQFVSGVSARLQCVVQAPQHSPAEGALWEAVHLP